METFREYDEATKQSDLKFPDSDSLWYVTLGITGESGEIADLVKRVIREDNGKPTEKRRELLLKECGDVLWYLNKLTRLLGSSLSEVSEMNIKKLTKRMKAGTIKGSGNDR